ncbi:aldolase/citrate lyase family protein [Lachnospiraceae bacterium 45-P1]
MALKLMYITNRPDVAEIAEQAGVDRIFIDMEYIGKSARQGGMDSVQNHHTIKDIKRVRAVLTKAELLVRINPIHEAITGYCSSKEEIDAVVNAGADIIMLPYFKTIDEVKNFVTYVNGRTKTLLLMETPEAAALVDKIISIPGIDEIHLGINDMSLGYGKTFMFELLADGTVENLCLKFKKAGIPYGFGGIASIGTGKLPAEAILKEHYRLGSSMVILSRSFCNVDKDTDISYIREKFEIGVRSIRAFEKEIAIHSRYFEENEETIARSVAAIVDQMKQSRMDSDKK